MLINKSQTRMTASVLKQDKKIKIKTTKNKQTNKKHQKQNKKTPIFIRAKHNMHIFGVIPFIKLQNDT